MSPAFSLQVLAADDSRDWEFADGRCASAALLALSCPGAGRYRVGRRIPQVRHHLTLVPTPYTWSWIFGTASTSASAVSIDERASRPR